MKIYSKLYQFNILVLSLFIMSCSNPQSIKGQEVNALKILEKYSLDYSPTNSGNPSKLPQIDNDLKEVLKDAIKTDERKSREFIVLIMVKLYRSHLECCNQAYEVRIEPKITEDEQPLLYHFITITGISDINESKEFLPSSIGYEYVLKNQNSFKNKFIEDEMKLIKAIKNRINKGDL